MHKHKEDNYDGEERRKSPQLTDEQLEQVADKVVERFHLYIGKAVIRAILYIIGPAAVLGYLWIKSKGL